MSVDHNLPVSNDNAAKSMDIDQTEPVRPVPPVKPNLKRRSAIAHLKTPLNQAVTDIVQSEAGTLIANVKLVRGADATVNTTALANPKKDKSRRIADGMDQSFKHVKRRREVEDKLLGERTVGTNSALTETGDGGVRPKMAEFVTDEGARTLRKPFGQQKGSASTTPGEVKAVNPGFKSGDNALQILGHLAGVFMRATKDMEYQCLLVNNRIFVAANEEANISSFKGMTLKSLLDAAAKTRVALTADSGEVRPYLIAAIAAVLALDPASKKPLTTLEQDGASMLAEHEAGHHMDHDARVGIRAVLNILQSQARTSPKLVGPVSVGTAAGIVNSSAHENAVILVEPSHKNGYHAEQTLAMVLLKARWTAGAEVAGTKFPCLACWHTLNLLPIHGFALSLVQNPGFYWSTQTLKGLTHVAQAVGIHDVESLETCFLLTQQHTYGKFHQFMTALRILVSENVDVTKKKLGDFGLTQDQSKRSFYYRQIEPNPVPITGAPYPEVVPGSPPGTWGSQPDSPELLHETELMEKFREDQAAFEKKAKEYEEAVQQKKGTTTPTEKKDPA